MKAPIQILLTFLLALATLGSRAELFVSSHDVSEVLRFNETNGAFIGAFVSANTARLDGPSGLALGPDGQLYVVGRFNNRVVRYQGQQLDHSQLSPEGP